MLEQIHLKSVATISRNREYAAVLISLIALCLLCWLDYITGDYSLIIFYLIPVSLPTWIVGKKTGLFFCILSLIARIIADYYSSPVARHSSLHNWNLFMEFLFLTIMSLLFSILKNRLDSEKVMARTDPLTKTINRHSFFNLAEREIIRARRHNRPFAIACIDLDNFKEINGRLGHSTGDKLLMAVVRAIKAHIRGGDILARFGSDEFVILLPETTGESARATLEKVHNQLQEAMSANSWPVTFSIGAVSFLKSPESIEEAIRNADGLMYEVKQSGKNRLLHVTRS